MKGHLVAQPRGGYKRVSGAEFKRLRPNLKPGRKTLWGKQRRFWELKIKIPMPIRVTVGTGISFGHEYKFKFEWMRIVAPGDVDQAFEEGRKWVNEKFKQLSGQQRWNVWEMTNFYGWEPNSAKDDANPWDFGKKSFKWWVNGEEHGETDL